MARSAESFGQTIQFESKLLNRIVSYNVILPRDYRSSTTTRYPVLYLLHGIEGHYSDWISKTNVTDYAADYRLIVVTPEGNNGWYTDSITQPSEQYESYFLKELIPDVQKRYRTIETRFGRGVAGLSMGGYGALKLALKSPGTFIFAGSLSGALWPSWSARELDNLPVNIRDSLVNVFGPPESATRKANDVFALVRSVSPDRAARLPYFYLDCGTEDELLNTNQQFAALLREKKIPHEYRELPGTHNWSYWDQQVSEVLKIAAEHLRVPRPVRR